jgi:hypothetical protein
MVEYPVGVATAPLLRRLFTLGIVGPPAMSSHCDQRSFLGEEELVLTDTIAAST